MPLDFDFTYLADEEGSRHYQAEPSYLDLAQRWLLSDELMATIERYERRLGRKLTPDEGQVLVQQKHGVDGPSCHPRFTRCPECGAWVDRGPLQWRAAQGGMCECQEIPF